MQKRKGFTLVELVIVIAVIAILAGVLIGTFASVINKANETAKLQEMKAAEHEQKADDLLKKIENSNWYGWEDFEASIVEKMTQVFKATTTAGTSITVDDVKTAVKTALKEYTDSSASQNTSLTEEQVKVIVEDAIGKINYNGVTEAQVRAIVSAAATSISSTQLTASQVKSIVNAAADKGLTAAQVAQVVGSLDLATTTNVNSAVNTITTAIANSAAAQLTTEDLANALIDLLPVTYKVANQTELSAALAKVNSFSTLNFTADFAAKVNVTDNRTLTIAGVKLTNLIVNAPLATIYLVSDEGTVLLQAVAGNSAHISGKIDSLEINKGRAVVEEGGVVTALTAIPEKNAVITVAVQPQAKVGTLTIDLQYYTTTTEKAAETVAVENAGKVDTVNVTKNTSGDNAQSTNVTVENTSSSEGATALQIAQAANTAKIEIVVEDKNTDVEYTVEVNNDTATTTTKQVTSKELIGSGTENDPYLIRTKDELFAAAALYNGGEENEFTTGYFKLTTDIDISDTTWIPFGNGPVDNSGNATKYVKDFTFDGQGHKIIGLNNRASFALTGTIVKNESTKSEGVPFAFVLFATGNFTVKNVTFDNVNIAHDEGNMIAGVLSRTAKKANDGGTYTFENIVVNGSISGKDKVAGIVAQLRNSTVTFINCTNNANVTAVLNYGTTSRAGGIGIDFGTSNITFKGLIKNTGCISSTNMSVAANLKDKYTIAIAGGIFASANGPTSYSFVDNEDVTKTYDVILVNEGEIKATNTDTYETVYPWAARVHELIHDDGANYSSTNKDVTKAYSAGKSDNSHPSFGKYYCGEHNCSSKTSQLIRTDDGTFKSWTNAPAGYNS